MKVNYNKRIIIVISSPSGAGKTSACHKLIERDKSIALSISDTTRSPRDNEIDGVDYNFINKDEFKSRIKNKSYIEYANVFGNFYGSQYKNIINHFMSRPQEVLKLIPKLIESKILIATFANINPSGIQGVIKIKIIFALYYITLFTWFSDENESLEKTMSALDKYLNNIEKVIKFS